MVGWLVPTNRENVWLPGLQGGVARIKLDDALEDGAAVSELVWIAKLHGEDSPLRLNDAKADVHGRLWFGSMNAVDEEKPDGVFYCAGPEPTGKDSNESSSSTPPKISVKRADPDPYSITNGPTFSMDGKTLYHTDSAVRTIYAFDLSRDGTLSNKRPWVVLTGEPSENGYPDGMTTDSEGNIWVARWGAGCVVKHAPNGRELLRVQTGAPHTSNLAFGGPDLADLYMTTARKGLSEDVADRTGSGRLFVVKGAGKGVLPNVAAAAFMEAAGSN